MTRPVAILLGAVCCLVGALAVLAAQAYARHRQRRASERLARSEVARLAALPKPAALRTVKEACRPSVRGLCDTLWLRGYEAGYVAGTNGQRVTPLHARRLLADVAPDAIAQHVERHAELLAGVYGQAVAEFRKALHGLGTLTPEAVEAAVEGAWAWKRGHLAEGKTGTPSAGL